MTSTAVQLRAHLPTSTTRLLVTVRDPQTRAYRPVGFLSQAEDDYRFSYLRRELERDAFRPLPGLARAAGGRRLARALVAGTRIGSRPPLDSGSRPGGTPAFVDPARSL